MAINFFKNLQNGMSSRADAKLCLAFFLTIFGLASFQPIFAEDAKTPVAEKKPYSEEAVKHYNKGVELHQSGFLNQAIAEYRGAIEADERMEEAWSNLGGIYAAQRSYAKAAEAFQKALTLKPDRPTTLNGLGTVLYARGKIEEAKTKWRQAIQADPKFASAYYNMANALENEHKIPEAVQEYVKAINVNPNMGDSFYRIATIYLKDQHLAQARVMFAKAVLLGPDAEYIRDAKKQLSALDLDFASDPIERREVNRNSGIQQTSNDASVGMEIKPKVDTQAAVNSKSREASKPVLSEPTSSPSQVPSRTSVQPTAQKPGQTSTQEPEKSGEHAINIVTDETGQGVQSETLKRKRKKEKKPKVKKESEDLANSPEPNVKEDASLNVLDRTMPPASLPSEPSEPSVKRDQTDQAREVQSFKISKPETSPLNKAPASESSASSSPPAAEATDLTGMTGEESTQAPKSQALNESSPTDESLIASPPDATSAIPPTERKRHSSKRKKKTERTVDIDNAKPVEPSEFTDLKEKPVDLPNSAVDSNQVPTLDPAQTPESGRSMSTQDQ